MTPKADDDLAKCRALISALAEQAGDRGYSAPVVADAMLSIAVTLAIGACGKVATADALRRVADRIVAGTHEAGPAFSRH